MKKANNSVIYMLSKREYFVKCPIRHNLNIIRLLVCQATGQYYKVWQYSSDSPITYESGRLYSSHYRICQQLKYTDLPCLNYKLPSTGHKIEDCLISQSCPPCLLGVSDDWKPSFLALTSNNCLIRFNLNTGHELQRVFLSNKFKFKHIEWSDDEHSFVLKSTHATQTRQTTPRSASPRSASPQSASPPLLAIALFTVWPLQFTGLIEIHKCIFGNDVIDALVNQSCLVVLHSGGLVRLYSIEYILQQSGVFDAPLNLKLPNTVLVGAPPTGLPTNIDITERPVVLFEVRCCDHDLVLGGAPWRYIVSPFNARGQFELRLVADNKLVEGGHFESIPSRCVEPDVCVFHEDDSGRILHVGAHDVRVLRVVEVENKMAAVTAECSEVEYQLHEDFVVTTQYKQLKCDMLFTQSGRQVRRRSNASTEIEMSYESVHSVTYEDDLDLLVVTTIQTGSHDDSYVGQVGLHDNQTGALLKQVELVEPWDMSCDHTIVVDLDTLLHIVKHSPGPNHTCHMYRLNAPPWQRLQSSSRHMSSRQRGRRRQSTRTRY